MTVMKATVSSFLAGVQIQRLEILFLDARVERYGICWKLISCWHEHNTEWKHVCDLVVTGKQIILDDESKDKGVQLHKI